MADRVVAFDLLRRQGPLAEAAEATAARLLGRGEDQVLPRGEAVFEAGAEASFLYLLLSGSIALRGQDETGAATVVDILSPGQGFLACPAVLGLAYQVSAVALTDAQLIAIPAEGLRDAMRRDDRFGRAMLGLMANEWQRMLDQVIDIKLRPAERRVAQFLARRAGAPSATRVAELPEPRGAIAARLGMTPETLSRSLAALEARGLIKLSAKRVELLDPVALLG